MLGHHEGMTSDITGWFSIDVNYLQEVNLIMDDASYHSVIAKCQGIPKNLTLPLPLLLQVHS